MIHREGTADIACRRGCWRLKDSRERRGVPDLIPVAAIECALCILPIFVILRPRLCQNSRPLCLLCRLSAFVGKANPDSRGCR
jgi:hypothetical protein